METNEYEVIVGNIGSVYTTTNKYLAQQEFECWVHASKQKFGRASGEQVTLFENGEPLEEHHGKAIL